MAKAITAPQIAAAAVSIRSLDVASIDTQLDSLIQSMAAFSPSPAAESQVLVGVYDRQPVMLASQS